VRIRELEAPDEDALRAFFDRIPADDRTFFKEDLEEPEILRRWIDDERGVHMFLSLGFTPEALLRDQLRGADGETQDVVLLSHFADEAAQDAALAMPEEAVW
jgi:hypothetical protein